MAELPPRERQSKATLILDLDGTLIATCRTEAPSSSFDFQVSFDPAEQPVWVNKRPGLEVFLKKASEIFEVVVFSLGRKEYLEEMRKKLDPDGSLVTYWLSRDSCSSSGSGKIKDFKDLNSPKFGRDLSKVVWVDDFKDSFKMNLENGLVVPMFRRSAKLTDTVLADLWPLLEKLAAEDDVRPALRSLPIPTLSSNLASTISRPLLAGEV